MKIKQNYAEINGSIFDPLKGSGNFIPCSHRTKKVFTWCKVSHLFIKCYMCHILIGCEGDVYNIYSLTFLFRR